jgi:uncharacterized protein (TIGR02246 family)
MQERTMYKVINPAQMNETFARAFNSRNLDNLLSLYENDAVLLVDGSGRACRGKAEIAEELSNLLRVPGVMKSVNNFCVEHGDVALLRADWIIADERGETTALGSTAELVGRQPDGRWLYVIDHAVGAGLPSVG